MATDADESLTTQGGVGLNVVPTARGLSEDTLYAGAGQQEDVQHLFFGLQIAEPLSITVRQTKIPLKMSGNSPHLRPGIDFKLKLLSEGRYRPALAFGMDGVLGPSMMSSEYFVLSKRYYDFDFTAGIGWGAMAGAGHLKNPFTRFGGHFDRARHDQIDGVTGVRDWFTGENIGFFGGFEYFTPVNGLSFKADMGGHTFHGVQSSAKTPWSMGINYRPVPWLSLAGGVVDAKHVMARVNLQEDIKKWPRSNANDDTSFTGPITITGGQIAGTISINGTDSPYQIAKAAIALEKQASPDIHTIVIIPVNKGIQGNTMTFNRRDIRALQKQGRISPEELWRNTSFLPSKDTHTFTGTLKQEASPRNFILTPFLNFSLGDNDKRVNYHTGLQVGERKHYGFGFFSGNDIALNVGNNLEDGGVNDFAKKTVLLERSFLSWMGTILPDTHIALSGGYLEEAFAGLGGEVLYRPHQSPFSIGIDAWRVLARAPDTPLGLGLVDGAGLTGHVTFGYEFPNSNLTAFTKIGRYLYGDDDITLGLEKNFDGGVKLKTFLSATNQRDIDRDGRKQGYYGGIELSLPLGHFGFDQLGTNLKIKSAPFSRVYGQILDKPVSLYDLTEPMSYRHLGQNWQGVQKNFGKVDAPP